MKRNEVTRADALHTRVVMSMVIDSLVSYNSIDLVVLSGSLETEFFTLLNLMLECAWTKVASHDWETSKTKFKTDILLPE